MPSRISTVDLLYLSNNLLIHVCSVLRKFQLNSTKPDRSSDINYRVVSFIQNKARLFSDRLLAGSIEIYKKRTADVFFAVSVIITQTKTLGRPISMMNRWILHSSSP